MAVDGQRLLAQLKWSGRYFGRQIYRRVGLLLIVQLLLVILVGPKKLCIGIPLAASPKIVPVYWLFLLFAPMLSIGDGFQQLLNCYYPLFLRCSLRRFALLINIFTGGVILLFWLMLWLALPEQYTLYLGAVQLFCTMIYSCWSLVVRPLYLQLGWLTLLLLTVFNGQPSCLSQTMQIRFTNSGQLRLLLPLLLTLVVSILMTVHLVKQADFTSLGGK